MADSFNAWTYDAGPAHPSFVRAAANRRAPRAYARVVRGVVARRACRLHAGGSCNVSRNPKLRTLSVSLPSALVERMRRLKFYYDVSASGIVEQALLQYFADASDEALGERLRALGARRRRPPGT